MSHWDSPLGLATRHDKARARAEKLRLQADELDRKADDLAKRLAAHLAAAPKRGRSAGADH